MAQKTSIAYFSDLSDVEITDSDAPTVHFGWDGSDYTIDLTAKEAEKFHKAIEPYLNAGVKVSGGRSSRKASSSKPASTGPDAKDVKAWADQQGLEYPSRGRLPKTLTDAYAAAH